MTVEEVSIWTTRLFGLLSLVSCICVAAETVAEWKANNVIHRIQAFLQLPLGYLSLHYMLPYIPGDSFCALEGFLYQLCVVAAILFDLSLSVCYLLMLTCNWKDSRLHQFVRCLHFVIWPLAIVPALYLLLSRSYSRLGDGCWIEEQPASQVAFATRQGVHITGVAHLVLSWYTMCRIYKFAIDNSGDRRARLLATNGFLYAASVSIIQTPVLCWALIRIMFGVESKTISHLIATPISLSGVLNMLVFFLNRRDMKTWLGKILRRTVDLFVCHVQQKDDTEYIQAVAAGRALFASSQSDDKADQEPPDCVSSPTYTD